MASKTWTVNHRGRSYSFNLGKLKVSHDHRAELVRVLREAQQDAGHAAKSVDVELAQYVIGLVGSGAEISAEAIAELSEIGDRVSEVMTEHYAQESGMTEQTTPDMEIMRELAAIVKDPKGLEALNRWRAGGSLTPGQQAIVDRHNQLERAHNDIADSERKSVQPPKPLDRYVGKDVWAWARHPDKVQRRQLAAEHRAKVLGDPKHPYWDSKSTEHRSAVLGMKAAIETMQTGESSVKIADDGTISE